MTYKVVFEEFFYKGDSVNLMMIQSCFNAHDVGIVLDTIAERNQEIEKYNFIQFSIDPSQINNRELAEILSTKQIVELYNFTTMVKSYKALSDDEMLCEIVRYLENIYKITETTTRFATKEIVSKFLEKNEKYFELRDFLMFFRDFAGSEEWATSLARDCTQKSFRITDIYRIYDKYGTQMRENLLLTDMTKIFGLLFSKMTYSSSLNNALGDGFSNEFASKIPTSNPIHLLTVEMIGKTTKKKSKISIEEILCNRTECIKMMNPVNVLVLPRIAKIDPRTFTDDNIATIAFYKSFCKLFTMSSLSLEIACRDVLNVASNFANFSIQK